MFLRKNDKMDSLIGQRSEFVGNISTDGTCRIDGRLIGNIKADWITIGESGSIKGNVSTRGVIIGGFIEGNIDAEDIIDIKPTGRLIGDITTNKLSVAEGGVFEGKSSKKKDEGAAKIIDFPAKESSG